MRRAHTLFYTSLTLLFTHSTFIRNLSPHPHTYPSPLPHTPRTHLTHLSTLSHTHFTLSHTLSHFRTPLTPFLTPPPHSPETFPTPLPTLPHTHSPHFFTTPTPPPTLPHTPPYFIIYPIPKFLTFLILLPNLVEQSSTLETPSKYHKKN